MRNWIGLAATTAAIALVAPVQATTFTGGYAVSANQGDGLVINIAKTITALDFTLASVGASTTINNLFTVWTPEADVGADDKIKQAISLSFNLDPVVTGSATGTTVGQTSGLFGSIQNGSLSWSASEFTLAIAGGGELGVSLTGGIFNRGIFWGLDNRVGSGLGVNATFRLISAPTPPAIAPVPEPASWAMMVGGFGLIGGALRRKTVVRFA